MDNASFHCEMHTGIQNMYFISIKVQKKNWRGENILHQLNVNDKSLKMKLQNVKCEIKMLSIALL